MDGERERMDSDEGKLFVGGIAWDTTEERLKEYFDKYGEVRQAVIMREKTTGRPRGFGFVVFDDPSVLDSVLQDKHTIDGRTVEAKRALSREEQRTNQNSGRSIGVAGNYRTKKIFVGGLPPALTEEEFRQYFENYGNVTDVVIMYDQNTKRPRGFGFITFDSENAVDRVLHKSFHDLNNKLVEVKPALPKEANPGPIGHGGGYIAYGPGSYSSSFDGQAGGNRFMQPQTSSGAYSPYPSYGVPTYGYATTNTSVGYGGYAGYVASSYGASAGFNGPSGPYGNLSMPNTSFLGGPPGAMRAPWSSQSPGYVASGYADHASYAAAVPWNASIGGSAVSGLVVPPLGGPSAYGYGIYGGPEGHISGRAGNGPKRNDGGSGRAREQQGTSGGYSGGASRAHSTSGWRSES